MNAGYKEAVLETGCLVGLLSPVTLTSGTNDYQVSAAPISLTDIMRFKELYVNGGGAINLPLKAVDPARILGRRRSGGAGAISGAPVEYSTEGLNLLMFWPTPSSGVTLAGYYVKRPPTLVASAPGAGEEATPTAFGSEFHEAIIENYALYRAFTYRGMGKRAQDHFTLYQAAIQRLIGQVEEFRSATASPVRVVRSGMSNRRYPDVG